MHPPHRSRFRALPSAACRAVLGAGLPAGAGTASAAAPSAAQIKPGSKVVGHFTEWGTYQRNYLVKSAETSGSAAKPTHINYAFGNVAGGKCATGDSYAATECAHTAANGDCNTVGHAAA
jgi:chitinase